MSRARAWPRPRPSADRRTRRRTCRHGSPPPHDRRRTRVGGVVGRLGGRERERDVLLELGLHERLVVRELEVRAAVRGFPFVVGIGVRRRGARLDLRRVAEGAVLLGHVGVGVAVGGVELGREVRVIARDRRVRVVTGHRLGDHVVGRRRRDLPAGAVEQQLGGRVVVDEELEADAAGEHVQRLRLGLGVRARAAVGLARPDRARSPRCRSPTCSPSCG